jgi:hypothetical protein
MFSGVLQKMTSIHDDPVRYILDFESNFMLMNQAINKEMHISKKGYCCLSCNGNIEIFANGFCKKCFFESPKSGDWVMRPELSKAHLNEEDRDLEFEKEMQLQPHIVYFSITSELKVGVTRMNNMMTRWVDQGAIESIILLELPNRYLAGLAEVELKEGYSDKTNWRKMLTNEIGKVNLIKEKKNALERLSDDLRKYKSDNNEVYKFNYNVLDYPKSVKSMSLKKSDQIQGRLIGIKGQYLIFEDSSVFNIRSNEGYVVEIGLK